MGRLPRFPLTVSALCGALACSHGCLPSLDVPSDPAAMEEPADMGMGPAADLTPGARISLEVSSVSPRTGKVSGGEEVTVRGRGFREGMKVSFYRSSPTSTSTTLVAQLKEVTPDSFKMIVPPAPDRISPGPVGILIDVAGEPQLRSRENIFSYHTDKIAFESPAEINKQYSGMQLILGADVDGDGKSDIVAAKNQINLFGVARQDTPGAPAPQFRPQAGFGSLGLPQDLKSETQAHQLIAADVTGDSVLDLLLSRDDGVYRCTGKRDRTAASDKVFGCDGLVNLFTGQKTAMDPIKVGTIQAMDISKDSRHFITAQTAAGMKFGLDFRSYDDITSPLALDDPKPVFTSAISSLAVVSSNPADNSYVLAVGLKSEPSGNLHIFRVRQRKSDDPIQLVVEQKLPISAGPDSILVSDLDLDENADLVIASESGAIDLVYGVSGGGFDSAVVKIREPGSPVQLRVKDVNGDSYPDLVYLAAKNKVFVRENSGARDFDSERQVSSTAAQWHSFDVAPRDSKGSLPDLILANSSTNQLFYSVNLSK